MKQMKFELKQPIEIARSGETGIIESRLDSSESKDQFRVQYKAADGRAVTSWFYGSELKALKVVKAEPKAKAEKKAPKKVQAKKKPVKKVRSKKASKKK